MANPTYLTRQEMESVVKEGGSVMWPPAHLGQTRIVTTIGELPSEMEIAEATGDEEAIKAAKKNLEAERDRIDKLLNPASTTGTGGDVPELPDEKALGRMTLAQLDAQAAAEGTVMPDDATSRDSKKTAILGGRG